MLKQRHPGQGNTTVDGRLDEKVVDPDGSVDDAARGAAEESRQISDGGTSVADEDQVLWAAPSREVTSTPVVTTTTGHALAARPKRRYTWGQALVVLAGVAALVFGIGAVALAGLAGSVTAPVVEVFTFDHTPLLGLIEIAVGAVLVLTGLVRGGRWIAGPVGVATVVGGALVLAELEWTRTELAAQQRFGWVPVIVGSAAYLGAMVPSSKRPPRPASPAPFDSA